MHAVDAVTKKVVFDWQRKKNSCRRLDFCW